MNKELVESIRLPDDSILEQTRTRDGNKLQYTQSAKEFVSGVPNQEEVEFVIDNLGEAVAAAHSDFCCNGNDQNYFIVDTGTQIYEMTFDLTSLRHLFGIYEDNWQRTQLCKKLKELHPELRRTIASKSTWLDKINAVLNPTYKNDILDHECAASNSSIEKLNWQKMAIKIFSFINMGLLEEGTTFFYTENRNRYSTGKPTYLLVRSLRNGELEDPVNRGKRYYNKQLIIQLVEDYDGSLTPQSIYIVNKTMRLNGQRLLFNIDMYNDYGIGRKSDSKKYINARRATITRKKGDRYAEKGNR